MAGNVVVAFRAVAVPGQVQDAGHIQARAVGKGHLLDLRSLIVQVVRQRNRIHSAVGRNDHVVAVVGEGQVGETESFAEANRVHIAGRLIVVDDPVMPKQLSK